MEYGAIREVITYGLWLLVHQPDNKISRDALILLSFHLFFFPAILFFLTYFAQYFTQKFPILLTFFQTQKRK